MDSASANAAQHIANGEFEAAEAILDAAVRAAPDAVGLRLAYSDSLAMQGQFDRAIEQCLRILSDPAANQSETLTAIDRLARCATQVSAPAIVRPYFGRIEALRRSPFPTDRLWPWRILRQAGFLEEARAGFEEVLRESPGDPLGTHLLGELMLEQGDAAGHRLSMASTSRAFARIYLSGLPAIDKIWEDEPLEGKSVAVYPYGGHGDVFQFAAHVPQLKRLGARHLTVIATAGYHKLLASAGVDEIVSPNEIDAVLARCDHWTTTFGLARAELNGGGPRKSSGFMAPSPSAIADTLSARMREKAAGRPCLGLYWYSDRHQGDVKSVPVPQLVPLLARRDVHWVVLQRGFGLRRMIEAGLDAGVTVADDVLPFDDAGALIARLDGLVSICAWPFHLAGALGVRSWLLAGRMLSSRHCNSDGRSYLYPDCATVMRQPRMGDWPGAVARLNAELDAFVSSCPSERRPTSGPELERAEIG